MTHLDLSLPIATPPWPGIGKQIESTVRRAIHQYDMLNNAHTVAIALSGGKDSLALLFMLAALSGRGFASFKLVAIHIAGEFTCGAGVSQNFLNAICNAMQIPLIIRTSTQKLETLECYSCSRERRSLLFAAAQEAGATTIAFGHHKDDHIQTLLMNLFHKAEFAGMLPKIHMVNYGVTIIRPLIYVEEASIRALAQKYGFQRVTCQCPVGQNSLRKKTASLLEHISTLYPHAKNNLAQAGFVYGSEKAAQP